MSQKKQLCFVRETFLCRQDDPSELFQSQPTYMNMKIMYIFLSGTFIFILLKEYKLGNQQDILVQTKTTPQPPQYKFVLHFTSDCVNSVYKAALSNTSTNFITSG